MSVKGGPHGDTAMGLALEQNGKKVSGTFATPHGDDLQVVGEFAEGTLTLATPGGGRLEDHDDGEVERRRDARRVSLEPDGRHDVDRAAREREVG